MDPVDGEAQCLFPSKENFGRTLACSRIAECGDPRYRLPTELALPSQEKGLAVAPG